MDKKLCAEQKIEFVFARQLTETVLTHSRNLLALIILLSLGFIWGSGYALAKYATTHGVPPLGYAFWQALGPAVLLTSACSMSKDNPLLRRSNWFYFLVCGLIGIAIPNTNMYFIAKHIPAGLLAVLVNTVPLIVYPLALIIGQERLDGWRGFALLLGMVGIFLIITPTTGQLLSGWTLLALLSPLSFALSSVYIAAKQPPKLNTLQAASGMLVAASVLLTPLVIHQQAFYPLRAPFTLPEQVVLLEIVLSSIGCLLFFQLIRLAGPVFYSFTGGIVALTGLFWGYVIFDEKPTALQNLAIFFIISALFLLSWRQSKQTRRIA